MENCKFQREIGNASDIQSNTWNFEKTNPKDNLKVISNFIKELAIWKFRRRIENSGIVKTLAGRDGTAPKDVCVGVEQYMYLGEGTNVVQD